MAITTFLERCSDPVLLCTEAGAIMWSNAAARRIFRLSSEALPSLSSLLPAEDASKILSTPHFSALPVELACTAGPLRQTVLSAAVGSGEPGGELYLLTFKSCGLPWQQREQGAEALAMITHDLKNPIGAIFGYADALLDTPIGAGLNEAQHNVIMKIRATAARSIEMLRNCELLFKLDAGSVQRLVKAVDLNEVARHVAEYAWRKEPGTAQLHLALAPGALPVAAERSQLDRIVSNLLTNAVKYTPPDGSIRVATRREQDRAVFEIHNDGRALADEELPLLFERYRRASTSKGTPGTGLGLYITKSLTVLLGGTIAVESAAERGTTFTVTLPLAA